MRKEVWKRQERKIKEWKLKEFNIRRLYEEKLSENIEKEGGRWDSMRVALLEVAREICGETRRGIEKGKPGGGMRKYRRQSGGRRKLSRGGRGIGRKKIRRYREKGRDTKRAVAAAKARA